MNLQNSTPKNINIMEICGTHTMSIAKNGIKQLLPSNVKLISGPGCPVCVTDQKEIDAALELGSRKDVILCCYGDMLRVPGSQKGDSLAKRRMQGAHIEIVFSPMDAIKIAEENRDKKIVFLGIGFETTAPGTAMAIKIAKEKDLKNFSVLCLLKRVEPVLRKLIEDPEFNVQGFLVPGHVASIIGEKGFKFLEEEYKIPSVISGFEAEDILISCKMLLNQIKENNPKLENQYKRAVQKEGNTLALKIMEEVLCPCDCDFRGIGKIKKGGFSIKKCYKSFDTNGVLGIQYIASKNNSACRCGEVIQGKLEPTQCPLFGKACTMEEPVGPCMVSSEGSCSAAYKYMEF